MLQNMAMSDVPFFVKTMYKRQNDATLWELYVHKYQGDLSFDEYKAEILPNAGSGLTTEEKVEQEKEALDYASQFIKFAQPKGESSQ